MLRITEKPWNIVVEGTPVELSFIKGKFSFDHPASDVMRRRVSYLKDWDGMIKLFRPVTVPDESGRKCEAVSLGRGFGNRLEKVLAEEDMDAQWVRREKVPPIPFCGDLLKDITLDPIQEECLRAMLAQQVCSIELGTGSGKSEIFFLAIACYLQVNPDARVLVVTPKKILLRDLEARFKKRLPQYADKLGMLGDSKADLKQIVIATPNSSRDNTKLVAYEQIAKWKDTVGLLILDEAHHSKSKGWVEVISTTLPDYLWAVSGKVVYKTSEVKTAELEAMFGPPVYVGFSSKRTVPVTVNYHYVSKWLSKFDGEGLYSSLRDGVPTFYRYNENEEWQEGCWRGPDENGHVPEWMCSTDEHTGKVTVNKTLYGIYKGDASKEVADRLEPQPDSVNVIYWTAYDMAVMEFSEFNHYFAKFAESLTLKGEKWLISVRRSRQIYKWKRLFKSSYPNLRVAVVDGSLSGKEQLRIFKELEDGNLDGVISQYTISAEGVDVPSLLHFIKLDNLSSEQLLEQQKGRVERIAAGKTWGIIHVPSMSQQSKLNEAFQKIRKYYTELRGLSVTKTKFK